MVEQVVTASIVEAEQRLMDPSVRKNTMEVEVLLDPAFVEIGQSGRLWSRETIAEARREPSMSSGLHEAKLTEVHVEQLAEESTC